MNDTLFEPLNPIYEKFWHVYIYTDKNDPKKGMTRAQIMDIKYNSKRGINVYFLSTYSKQEVIFGNAFVFVPCPPLKILRPENEILRRG